MASNKCALLTDPVLDQDAALNGIERKRSCGIIMPISPLDGYPANHWDEVRKIIEDTVTRPPLLFTALLVSSAQESGVIHKRIIQNTYSNDIVICDVSGLNPNVMFELGLRLAFNKPTVLIKDDATKFTFDTGVIEHLQYPRDLRYHKMVAFQDELAQKVMATFEASLKPDAKGFLDSFGVFKVAQLPQHEVPIYQYMVSELADIKRAISGLRAGTNGAKNSSSTEYGPTTESIIVQWMLKKGIGSTRLLDPYLDELSAELKKVPAFSQANSNLLSKEIKAAIRRLRANEQING